VEELARSNRDLEQFAYIASHDLQEPLRMVAAYTQLLAERYRSRLDENAEQYIAYAVEGALRMQALIQDLLAFSRVGRNGVGQTCVDSDTVVDEVLQNLRTAIEQSAAVIHCGKLPAVHGNRTQLAQLFQNLIGNAIKFRGETAPIITVSGEKQDDMAVFTVADNGIGIAPEHLELIFVIFQRLHTRDEYAGNGVGLAICKKIVEQHGGRIWVESRPGTGSTFRFSLPTASADQKKGQS
jgi:light-regulated signal transduction histidine kinase (bacteriophytochrome)